MCLPPEQTISRIQFSTHSRLLCRSSCSSVPPGRTAQSQVGRLPHHTRSSICLLVVFDRRCLLVVDRKLAPLAHQLRGPRVLPRLHICPHALKILKRRLCLV